MRLKTAIAAAALLSLPVGSAMADTFWRNVMTSGATTASSYLTSKDHKMVVAAQDDAGSFVASEGAIRGPYRRQRSVRCAPTTLACKRPTWTWPTLSWPRTPSSSNTAGSFRQIHLGPV